MKTLKYIIITVIILFLLIIGIKQQIDINTLNKQISDLEENLEKITYENDKKENDLETPSDDMMEKYAQEYGYKDPDALYFYNDFNG
ncbi:MAG: septum formation initiator family protein [Clostridiales bacterium]|nr:septum formation initiator family protein [Clostridia bacterium]MCR5353805.1 septum formation initiator family protein [Clostridiales bacterium]